MPSDLEKEFHQLMLDLYWDTGNAIGYWANYYLRKVRRVGGLQTAKDLLKPTAGIAPGLERLAREHRLDLSIEQIVLQKRWRPLFTEAELKVARERLAQLPKY